VSNQHVITITKNEKQKQCAIYQSGEVSIAIPVRSSAVQTIFSRAPDRVWRADDFTVSPSTTERRYSDDGSFYSCAAEVFAAAATATEKVVEIVKSALYSDPLRTRRIGEIVYAIDSRLSQTRFCARGTREKTLQASRGLTEILSRGFPPTGSVRPTTRIQQMPKKHTRDVDGSYMYVYSYTNIS